MINCPNPSCNELNTEGTSVCRKCRSALPHRYLWGVGKALATLRVGELYQNRYLLKRDRIFLDTQPGQIPESIPELPDFLLPYLHLSAYPSHIPRPYAVISSSADDYVLMLESSALSTPIADAEGNLPMPTQLPKLSARWKDAPPLRQLSWLWQIAQVWEAFQTERVASTLLTDELVRVDGSIVRFLELTALPVAPTNVRAQLQPSSQPALTALGKFWQPLADSAHQSVRFFLNRLCEQLERQQLNAEQLTEQLSRALSECAIDQVVNYDLAVYTDQGPTRKRNEDACYPESGTSLTLSSEQTAQSPQLLIVCDGIGGHQGGDVASKLAIAAIESRLTPLLAPDQPDLTPTELTLAIENAICAANDEISAQNDQAQRQARDRMGTTLVLALVQGASVYIAHLGDSRAYRIGHRNCQQVTLDDDVASRQVRLGGSLYREVLVQPGSGSLIQALGMSSSQMLRPTVQRFVLDENCVFLLCSDGLSDSDRVEQFWQQVLRPLVTEERSTAEVGQKLIALANKFNGHDNVTVGLVRAQVVRPSERMLPRELAAVSAPAKTAQGKAAPIRGAGRGNTQITSIPTASTDASADARSTSTESLVGKQNNRQNSDSVTNTEATGGLQRIGLFVGLLAVVGSVLYFLFPDLSFRFRSSSEAESSRSSESSTSAPNGAPPAPNQPLADIAIGNYLRIRQSDVSAELDNALVNGQNEAFERLLLYPDTQISPNELPGVIPTGGIVQVIQQRKTDEARWVEVKLCSIPSGSSSTDVPSETDAEANVEAIETPAQIGGAPLTLPIDSTGWAIASTLAAVSDNIDNLDPTQQGECTS